MTAVEEVPTSAAGNPIGFDLIDAVRQRILPFFTEGRNGEALLFDLSVFPLWMEYFRDQNLTYHQNNLLTLYALREGLPLKKERWASYLDWAVDAFKLATVVAAPATQIVTHRRVRSYYA